VQVLFDWREDGASSEDITDQSGDFDRTDLRAALHIGVGTGRKNWTRLDPS
jgi:uncharacterized protein (DUF433 family)